MYSYKFVQTPGKCAAGCGTIVTNRLAGHYYVEPMCDRCFREADPEVARAIAGLQPSADVRVVEGCSGLACANCGDRLSGRNVGHHKGDPLCVACLREHEPRLAALLRLEEAVLIAVRAGLCAEELLTVAVWYARALDALDAES